MERKHCAEKLQLAELRYDSATEALNRWSYAEASARAAISWQSLDGLNAAERTEAFDLRMAGRIDWMIEEAFALEDQLDEAFGRRGFTVDQVREMLLAEGERTQSANALHESMAAMYEGDERAKSLFPHLLDSESESYTRFEKFLDRVFDGLGSTAARK